MTIKDNDSKTDPILVVRLSEANRILSEKHSPYMVFDVMWDKVDVSLFSQWVPTIVLVKRSRVK